MMHDPTEYEFDQMMAEAKAKIGTDAVLRCVEPLARIYGWPIPPEKRLLVAIQIALLIREQTT
jgi:hypothetical protein